MNVIREIGRLNEIELENGSVNTSASWHAQYAHSPWCFVGNLPLRLTEGDVLCFMSQYGEIQDIHLVRHEETGESKGFAFVRYEDARSCVLAVDNFVGIKVLGRSLRVDHVEKYRLPKHVQEKEDDDEDDKKTAKWAMTPGHAYEGQELASGFDISQGQDLFAPLADPKTNGKKEPSSKGERKAERARIRREREERRSLRRHKRNDKKKRHSSKKKDDSSAASGEVEEDEGGKRPSRKRRRKRRHDDDEEEEDHHRRRRRHHHHHHESSDSAAD